MTPWQRGLCRVGLGAGLLVAVLPYGSVPADAAAVSAYGGVSAYGSGAAYESGAAYDRGSTRSSEATHGPGRAHGRPGPTFSPGPGPGARNDRVPSYPRDPSKAPVPTSPAGSASASSIPSASSASPSGSSVASGGPDRAGSRAGEGRIRPGRTGEAAETDPEVRDEETSAAEEEGFGEEPAEESAAEAPREAGLVPSSSPQTVRRADAAEEQPVGRMLRILPLGSGLVLIGLGLGLAFVGLRLRRG
ncbi:hypothetical protein ACF05L_12010 [Streptomyces bobili]|uniref:hypothetical protein n=1 Tax=Streptomyces bobili TaxID=67280 RepID=UPI0036FA0F7A